MIQYHTSRFVSLTLRSNHDVTPSKDVGLKADVGVYEKIITACSNDNQPRLAQQYLVRLFFSFFFRSFDHARFVIQSLT